MVREGVHIIAGPEVNLEVNVSLKRPEHLISQVHPENQRHVNKSYRDDQVIKKKKNFLSE